jgi:hypothetical protein
MASVPILQLLNNRLVDFCIVLVRMGGAWRSNAEFDCVMRDLSFTRKEQTCNHVTFGSISVLKVWRRRKSSRTDANGAEIGYRTYLFFEEIHDDSTFFRFYIADSRHSAADCIACDGGG